ncbi:hypothetical protein JB92DRAFT_3127052 [Gautieria morchelliformis]|nr:hypothetical protein JB92DRAFT_3127052 [Gautieria morchelliformis]
MRAERVVILPSATQQRTAQQRTPPTPPPPSSIRMRTGPDPRQAQTQMQQARPSPRIGGTCCPPRSSTTAIQQLIAPPRTPPTPPPTSSIRMPTVPDARQAQTQMQHARPSPRIEGRVSSPHTKPSTHFLSQSVLPTSPFDPPPSSSGRRLPIRQPAAYADAQACTIPIRTRVRGRGVVGHAPLGTSPPYPHPPSVNQPVVHGAAADAAPYRTLAVQWSRPPAQAE